MECRLEYPDVCPAVLCAGLVAAVHAHRQAHWQVGHGFLGLPNRTIERARHSLGGRRGSGEKPRRRSARQVCQVRIAKPARRVGPTADAKCAMGVEQRVADCVRRATCARRCAARRAWQRSVWRRAWHGTATKLPGRALGVHAMAVARVQEVACGRAARATTTANRPVNALLRGRAMQCGCCWAVSHGHQGRRAAWGCTSVATAVASACGGKTSRLVHRTIAWG